jgi:DNA-binding NarL/FixJ family response regulator
MGNVTSSVQWSSVRHVATTQLCRQPSWTYYSQVSVANAEGWADSQRRASVHTTQGSMALALSEAVGDAIREIDDDSDLMNEEPPKEEVKEWGPWSLTQRELEVLQLLAEGSTNSEISSRLFISPKTTKNHLAAIFQKLDVTNRTHALVRAVVMGLVSIE